MQVGDRRINTRLLTEIDLAPDSSNLISEVHVVTTWEHEVDLCTATQEVLR